MPTQEKPRRKHLARKVAPATSANFASDQRELESDDPRDLYSADERELATLEPAWAKAALFFRTAHRAGHEPVSVRIRSLLEIHQELEARRLRLARGETLEILHAIDLCALENLPLPTWLALAYRSAFAQFVSPQGTASSLDAVFSSETMPTTTPKKAASARQGWLVGYQLRKAAWKTVIADAEVTTITNALNLVLGQRKWGVKPTVARRLLLFVDTTVAELQGRDTLSRFLEIRRKHSR